MIKKIYLILLLGLINFSGFSQNYADKDYYLIDSLNLDELSKYDRQLLDSNLAIYHSAKHDTDRINALGVLQEKLISNDWIKYNLLIKNKVQIRIDENPTNYANKFYFAYLATSLNNIGYIKQDEGKWEEALDFYHKSLKIEQNIGDQNGAAMTLNNIGYTFNQVGNNEKALAFYNKSLKLYEGLDNKAGIDYTLTNIGLFYYEQDDFLEALEYYKRCLKIVEDNEDQIGIAIAQLSIGKMYFSLEKFDDAMIFYKKALVILKEENSPPEMITCLRFLSYISLKKDDLERAETYAKQSLELANQYNYPKQISLSSKMLSTVYENTGDYKNSLKLFQAYYIIRDSLRNNELDKSLVLKETKYQIEQKEQEIKFKQKNIELLEKDKKIKKYTLYGLIIFIVLLISVALLWFKNYNQQKKTSSLKAQHKIDIYLKEIDVLRANINTQMADDNKSDIIEVKVKLNDFLTTALSERELEVLEELSKGKTNKKIADSLFVSVNTIKTHLLNIYEKLDVSNRTQAIHKMNEITQKGG